MQGSQLASVAILESLLQKMNIEVHARWAEAIADSSDSYYLITFFDKTNKTIICCVDPSGQIEPSLEELYERF